MRKRWHWPRLLGPLFAYDLVASTRRGQHTVLRVCMGFGMLAVILAVYLSYTKDYGLLVNPFKASRLLSPHEMPLFAHSLAGWCLVVQFGAVVLLTPSIVADAIAREKERRALDFLFVTDLTNREIIFGKLGARLAYIVGVLLTGLPALALTQLWGGVDAVLLYGGYAAVFATMFSLGALSMLCSVSSQTAVQATVRAYLGGTALVAVSGGLLVPVFEESDSALFSLGTYIVANLMFTAVSLYVCVRELRPTAADDSLTVRSTTGLRAAAKVAVAATTAKEPAQELMLAAPAWNGGQALLRIEPGGYDWPGWDPVEPLHGEARPLPLWEPADLPRTPLPPVQDDRPLLWKEVHLHSFTRGQSLVHSPLLLFFLILGAVVIGVYGVSALFVPSGALISTLASTSNIFVRNGTLMLAGAIALGVLLHAVNSVTRERERGTLDGLIVLPVERADVLRAKWLGGPVSLRLIGQGLGLLWLLGLLTAGIHPLALARLVFAVAAPIAFLTSLGLWLSVVCRSSLRANLAAVLCLLLVACGPAIVVNYLDTFVPAYGPQSQWRDMMMEALMPPMTWAKLCVTWPAYQMFPPNRADVLLLGSAAYAVAAWALWRSALCRFNHDGGSTKSRGRGPQTS